MVQRVSKQVNERFDNLVQNRRHGIRRTYAELMLEVSPAGEDHRQAPLVARGDDLFVASGSAGLNNGRYASVGGRFDRFKLLYTQTERGRELLELYDLRTDPAETVNLQAEASTLPNAVWVAFHDFVERARQPGTATLSTETLQELRSLGYVQ